MPRESIVTGLDIGTHYVRTVIAQFAYGDQKPQIVGIGVAPSRGLRHGVIVDSPELIESIKQSVEMAEQMSGLSVNSVFTNISGNHINSRPSSGLVVVSRADGEIGEEDIKRVNKAAQAIPIQKNREILCAFPRNYVIDSHDVVKDPVGMKGSRLEVDALLIEAASPFINSLNKCVNEAGFAIDEIVLSSLAASKAVLSKRQRELGVIVLDIGSGVSDFVIFEEGDIVFAGVLPLGSAHITNDIAIGLRTDIDTAEKVKLEFGSVLPHEIKKSDIIDLSAVNANENGIIPRRDIARFIEARSSEILELIYKELKRANKQLLPGGVILLGGGVKLYGFVDLAKRKLSLPAQLGFPVELSGLIDKVNDPSFATAVGLVLWGTEKQSGDSSKFRVWPPSFKDRKVNDTVGKITNWFKGFMP